MGMIVKIDKGIDGTEFMFSPNSPDSFNKAKVAMVYNVTETDITCWELTDSDTRYVLNQPMKFYKPEWVNTTQTFMDFSEEGKLKHMTREFEITTPSVQDIDGNITTAEVVTTTDTVLREMVGTLV